MYQPQRIICAHCGHQGQIITEDIRLGDLSVVSSPSASISQLVAHVECPSCHQKFDLVFTERRRNGSEVLYVCDNQPNRGLEMWRRWENGIPSSQFMPQTMQAEIRLNKDLMLCAKEPRIISWNGMVLALQAKALNRY